MSGPIPARVGEAAKSRLLGIIDEAMASGWSMGRICAVLELDRLRIAFSTVNDTLGAQPDHELGQSVPAAVRDAVTFGRSVAREVGDDPAS